MHRSFHVIVPFFLCMALSACALDGLNAFMGGEDSSRLSSLEEQLIRRAEEAKKSGNAKEAIHLYTEAAKISKGAVQAHLALADLLKTQKDAPGALGVLKDAATLQPNNGELLKELGNGYIAAGQPKEAITAYERAIAAMPDDPRAYNGKAVALDMMEKYGAAQEYYAQALAHAGEDTDYIHNNQALSLIMLGKYEEAIALLETLVEKADVTPTMRQNLALAYGLSGKKDKARIIAGKDLTSQQIDENDRIYDTLSPAAGGFKAPDTAVEKVGVSEMPAPSAPSKRAKRK